MIVVGTIIFIIILVILLPVAILMSFGALAGIVSYLAKTGVDSDHVTEDGTPSELLAISQANPWAGPAEDTDDTEAEATDT